MAALPQAMYVPDGAAYVATALTRGPWDPAHQHGGPPAALLARELDRAGRIAGGTLARVSYDILRPVPIERLEISARVARPGRRVELVEATLRSADGEAVMDARGWRVAGGEPPSRGPSGAGAGPSSGGDAAGGHPLGDPGGGRRGEFGFWRDEVAYHRALDWRFVRGNFDEPGAAATWSRLECELVAGESPAPLERLIVMADAASGISAVLDWQRWLFINVDLGIHLERPPHGEWMAMAAETRVGPGLGLCAGELYDIGGRVGVSTQTLLIARRT